jgi:hypothetical protein
MILYRRVVACMPMILPYMASAGRRLRTGNTRYDYVLAASFGPNRDVSIYVNNLDKTSNI